MDWFPRVALSRSREGEAPSEPKSRISLRAVLGTQTRRKKEGEAPSEPITAGSCHGLGSASPENWEGEPTGEPKSRTSFRAVHGTQTRRKQEGEAPSEPVTSGSCHGRGSASSTTCDGRTNPDSRGGLCRFVRAQTLYSRPCSPTTPSGPPESRSSWRMGEFRDRSAAR